MSWTCLAEHRLTDAHDVCGTQKWRSGCAICEIERLRGWLERIAEDDPNSGSDGDFYCRMFAQMALDGKEQVA